MANAVEELARIRLPIADPLGCYDKTSERGPSMNSVAFSMIY